MKMTPPRHQSPPFELPTFPPNAKQQTLQNLPGPADNHYVMKQLQAKLCRKRCARAFLCCLLLLLPFSLAALDPAKTVYQLNCRNWTRQNGLPVNGISSITQTKDGYLWLGTQKGLVRFDGNEFKLVSLPNGADLPGLTVSCAIPANTGGLWFGISSGAFAFFDGQHFVPAPRQPWFDSHMNVLALQQTADGALWVGTDAGTARIVSGDTNATSFYEQLSACSALYQDHEGRVWLGTAQTGLYYWKNGALFPFPDDSLKQHLIFAVVQDSEGRLWVGTDNGVRCYNPDFTQKQIPGFYTETRALLVDHDGVLWMGTSGQGLARYSGGEFNTFHKGNGLAGDSVTALCGDREGSLWVATREGLSQLSDVKLPIFSATEGLPPGACHGVAAANAGGLLVAMERGLCCFNGDLTTNLSSGAGLSTLYSKRPFQDSHGDVYLIDGQKNVVILSGNKPPVVLPNKTWPVGMAEDSEGVIVSVGGDLFRVQAGQLTPYPFQNGLAPPMYWVLNLCVSRDGALWVASANGIFRIQDGRFQQWNLDNGLSSTRVNWICEDADGVIWAGLTSGLTRIKNGKARTIGHDEGLFDDYIYSIIPDNLDGLWVNSARGIFRLGRQSLNNVVEGRLKHLDCVAYDGPECVKTIDTSAVEASGCKTKDGRIWFPTPQGLVMIDPAHLALNRIAPAVHLERLRVDGLDIPGKSIPTLRPGYHEVEFYYAGLSYIAPQKVRYRYQLAGYDPEWVDAGGRSSARYTNLKPGQYLFRVQACNADGVWNTSGDSVALYLPPHFYETWWFQFLVAVAALAALLGIYAWRIGHLRHRERRLQNANESLESKVRERTGELANANQALKTEIESHKALQVRLVAEITEREKADRALAEQRNLLRTLIDHLPDNVFVKDRQSRVVLDNIAHARHLGLRSPDEMTGKTDFDCLPPDLARKFFEDEQKLMQSGEVFNDEESSITVATGERRWSRTTKVPLRDSQGNIIGLAGINRDITDRKEAEAKMESLHRQLVEASRYAGMAEVACGVLHNVGNVLNSVNVSASVLGSQIKQSRAANLPKIAALFRQNADNLAAFFAAGGKGHRLLDYLDQLGAHLEADRAAMLAEVESLSRNIDHIKEIVAMQQAYARVSGVLEKVRPAELVEDALRMQAGAFQRHSVKVLREFADVPPALLDRHKTLQILVNLLQNAKYACEQNDPSARTVKVYLRLPDAEPVRRLRIQVADNGVGIPPENLTRIFTHGFTTRKNGHGFGLHSGSLAAREMGGTLSVHSSGPGQGAVFTLDLPLAPEPGGSTLSTSIQILSNP